MKNYENRIETIKTIIRQHQLAVNDISVAALKQIASFKNFVPDVKESKVADVKNSARQRVREKAIANCARLQIEFDNLRADVIEWLSTPLPLAFTDIIQLYNQTGVELTLTELKALVRLTDGNYFAKKAISTLAAKDHNIDIPFVSVDEILKNIGTCEADAKTAVNGYSGIDTPWLTDVDNFFKIFADEFLDKRQSSFTTMQTVLSEATSTDDMITTGADAVANVFADIEDGAKLDRMIDLLMSDTFEESRLMAYDGNLYLQAKNKIAETKRRQAKQASEEAHRKQVQAARASADASKAQSALSKQ